MSYQRVLVAGWLWMLTGVAALAQTSMQGTWQGRYQCGGSQFDLTLTVMSAGQNNVSARAAVRPEGNRGAAEFELAGIVDPASGQFELRPTRMLGRFPGFRMAGYRGKLPPGSGNISAAVMYPGCADFTLARAGQDPAIAQPVPTPQPLPPTAAPQRPGMARRPVGGGMDVPPQAARDAPPELLAVAGEWEGTAVCGRETRDIVLKVSPSFAGDLDAIIETYGPGSLSRAVSRSNLKGRPEGSAENFRFVAAQGTGPAYAAGVASGGAELSVTSDNCGKFALRRVTERSPSRVASVSLPTAGGTYRPDQAPESRCQALIQWADHVSREYPSLDFRRTSMEQLLAKGALLFADDDFVPAFGFAYDAASSLGPSALSMDDQATPGLPRQTARNAWNDLAFECRKDPFVRDKGGWIWGHPFWEALHFDLNRFDANRYYGGYFSPAALNHAIQTTRALRNEIKTNAIAKQDRPFPDRAKDMLAFKAKVSGKAELLWPSETANATAALTRSLNDMAATEGERVLADLAQTRDPAKGLQLVAFAMRDDVTGILPNLDDARRKSIRARIEARQSEYASAAAKPLVERSVNAATSVDGAREVVAILRESQAAFALFGPADRKRFTGDLEARRDQIVSALIAEDLRRLQSYEPGQDGLKKSADWMSKFTSQYGEFSALQVYAEGRNAFLINRAARLVDALKGAEAELRVIGNVSTAKDSEAATAMDLLAGGLFAKYLCWEGDRRLPESLEYDALASGYGFGLPLK